MPLDLQQPDPRRDPTGIDAFKPAEVAKRIEDAGATKAALHALPLAVLSVMAGIFIALGAAAFIAWVGVIAHRELSRPPLLPLPAHKQWVRQCGPRSRELCRK